MCVCKILFCFFLLRIHCVDTMNCAFVSLYRATIESEHSSRCAFDCLAIILFVAEFFCYIVHVFTVAVTVVWLQLNSYFENIFVRCHFLQEYSSSPQFSHRPCIRVIVCIPTKFVNIFYRNKVRSHYFNRIMMLWFFVTILIDALHPLKLRANEQTSCVEYRSYYISSEKFHKCSGVTFCIYHI